jgi:hypothetical protein
MSYHHRPLKSGVTITSLRPEHAEPLGELQKIVFPTLDPEEIFRPEHYLKHIELFPEGQFVALFEGKVIGSCSSIRYNFDFDHDLHHTFADMLQGGWLTSHQPDGEWMYGMDINTHPQYRRMGVARGFYYARQEYVRKAGLRGQVAGGMLSGFGAVKETVRVEEYFDQLLRGEIFDPTVSAQLRVGFRAHCLLPGYISDPVCDNYGVLIVLDASQDVYSE